MIRAIFISTMLFFVPIFAHASDDMIDLVKKQRIEIEVKEKIVKKEMARLKELKKEINDDIVKYTAVLKQIDKSLEKAQEIASKRLRHIAKAYEAMQPEDAASRLTGLDNETAVQILLKMASKKAGLVIGMMESKKATTLTKEIAKIKKI